MAKAGYPSGPGAGPKNLDTTTAAGHYGAGGDNNGGGQTTPPGEPASIDISLGGGFLQGTGSIANNVFDDPQHVDGTITFQSSSVEAALDRSKYPYPRYRIPQNQRRRFQIINEKRAILNRPIEILDFNTGDFIMPELDQNNLTFSMSFENTDVIPATSTTFLGSYADVTLGNLRTYSGDIHRMKVYARHQNDQAEDFNRIGDFVVRDKNELIDKTSPTGQAPIGIFYSQSVIDNHWISSSNSITPMSVANNELISAAFLSGSNRGDGEFFDFQTRKYIPLRKAQDYIVNFSSYFIKKPKVQPDGSVIDSAKIELLLSGSIESSQNDLLSLGTISGEGDDSSETLEGRISGSIPNLFNYFRTYSNVAGEASASLVFRVHAGEFHVSNVALRPLTFANFHPDSYNVRLPMPKKAARNQQYDFRVEFYDFNNNKSVATTESTASVFFAGTNDVIDGFDNKIEGAQTWGNSMEAYGVSGNSAYLRSIGYNGFAKTTAGSGERDGGFMMWSGSIGSRITASEAYNGVGLEIVDASATDPSNHRFLQFASNYKNSGNSRFRVQTDEFLLGISSSAANNYISGSNGKLEISSSNFELNGATGNVTLQGIITATAGGTIGGFTIGSSTLSTGTGANFIALDSTNKKLRIGAKASLTDSNTGVHVSTDGIALGASSVFKVEDDGTLTATAGTIGGFSITSTELFSLDSGTPDSSPNNGITIDTTGGSNSKAVIKVFDGTTENAALGNFASGKFGIKAIEGEIGGWTIGTDSITGGNLILNSAGIVESSTYVSGLKGFRLSAENNGFLEVENAKIRGTLRTTVFEKESVNAVGGQLQVGNATTITGSATITATATSIPVENVTGFTGSEIILAKKVGSTGFSTEYMLITSQSRRDKTSDTDFSGSLFVVRGYSGSVPTTHITSSLGDSPSSPTTLEPGQVLVSTGHFNAATTSGSGYIRMNANPNDPTTPYMDIVERTGSKIYEVDLKARLGDLSGLSTGFVGTNPGFGLFTERAFLTKDVTIGTLGSEHILLTDSSLLFKNGAVVKAQLDGNTWTLGGATGTTSDSVVIGAGGVKIYDNSVDYVSITSAGLSVFEGDASNPVAVFGTDATVGLDEAGKSNVFVDSDGNVDIRRGTQVSASFGTTTTIGPTTGQHVSIDSDSFDIKKGSQVSASFGTTTTIGPTTGQHVLIDSDSLDVKVGSTVLSTFGTDMTIGKTSGTNRNVFVDSNGNIDIKRGSQVSASFGTTTTIGPTSGQHVSIDSDSFDIKKGSEVSASFGTTTTIGPTSGDHVLIDNDSVDIKDGSSVLSSFGATTTIGNTATEHVSISSTELKLKDGNGGGTDIDYVTINSSGMQIGDDITISTAGASSLSIGNLANVADIGDTSTGFLVDSSGNVLIKQGAANKNYMQFSGSVIDLQSDTFNLVTTGSGAGEDGGLIINSAQPLIMISGSRGSVTGNSVRLLGDEGVLEVSQSGEGVFDTGRTKTFTTSTIIEPAVFKPGVVSKGYVSSSTQTVQAAPRMDNLAVGNIQAGGLIDTNAIFLDTARSSTAFAMVNDISRNNAATNPDGVAKPTASFAVNHTVNYTANTQNSNCHPAFTFNADYFTELAESGTNNTLGWVQNSVPSGSNIFTISTTARDVNNTDFEDAKFNILGLESNTSGLHLNRQNEYTFLQAKHSGSIRLQIQHDGDVISKGNITAFGTSFLTVSDEREKFDVHTISESLDRILDLRPTKFTWIETSKDDVGFIAQEVEEVIPEVVETSRGFINTGDDKERKTIAYPKLVPYLVDTIQVLTKRIEELEKKVK